MSVRLRDIAEKLNLSPALVSGVLNDRPNIWASEETRQRVHRAAQELGYRPNPAARALSSGKTSTIAFVYNTPGDLFTQFRAVNVAGILGRYLNAAGWEILVRRQDDQKSSLSTLEELARSRACDAFVLWSRDEDIEEQALYLESIGKPFVVKGHHAARHPEWFQVEYDHACMMEKVVARLAGLGHSRIGYLGFNADDAFRHRLRDGFQAAMRRRFGREAEAAFVSEAASHSAATREKIRSWLALPQEQQPTALAVGAGNGEWEAIELELARRGRKIGEGMGELAVAGLTGVPMSLLFGRGQAFLNHDFSDLAEAVAARFLPALLRGEAVDQTVIQVCPELSSLPSLGLLDYVAFRAQTVIPL